MLQDANVLFIRLHDVCFGVLVNCLLNVFDTCLGLVAGLCYCFVFR